jgi:2-dehydro-3-deoxyphosphogluconate aldolase/(4S)-4-hydroxy-2-oxoglutarate aldolase
LQIIMNRKQVADRIVEIGIVPIIRAASTNQAMYAVEGVCAGGIPIVEITMTVPGAIDLLTTLARTSASEILIGAGTVLDAEDARRCVDAGAQFIVSPGFDGETVKFANSSEKLIMTGALSPTEVITAWKAGSDFIKVFPCGSVGGAKYIKALKAPLPHIPMVPTGGVNLKTAPELIEAGAAAIGIGGELVSASALQSGNTSEISETARRYVAVVREARARRDSGAT